MCCTSRRICTFIAARLSSAGDDIYLWWGSDTDLQSDRTLSLRMGVSSSHFRSSKWESWSSDQWTRCTSATSVTSHTIMDSTTNVDRSRRLNRYDLQDGTHTETWPISKSGPFANTFKLAWSTVLSKFGKDGSSTIRISRRFRQVTRRASLLWRVSLFDRAVIVLSWRLSRCSFWYVIGVSSHRKSTRDVMIASHMPIFRTIFAATIFLHHAKVVPDYLSSRSWLWSSTDHGQFFNERWSLFNPLRAYTLAHETQNYPWLMFHTRNVSTMQVSCVAQTSQILSSSLRRHALQACLPATLHVVTRTSWDEFTIARCQHISILADVQYKMLHLKETSFKSYTLFLTLKMMSDKIGQLCFVNEKHKTNTWSSASGIAKSDTTMI